MVRLTLRGDAMSKVNISDGHPLVSILMFGMVGWLWLAPATAQTPAAKDSDSLDRLRSLSQVAVSKIETEVRDALRETDRLSLTDPENAADRLKKMLTEVGARG